MYDVQAVMHMTPDKEVWAFGTITINNSIRFGIQMRSCKDPESGNQSTFLGLPRREKHGCWENVLELEPQLKEQIMETVTSTLKAQLASELHVPEVEVISVTPVCEHAPEGAKAHICGLATIRVCGITIRGITVKRGTKGLFVNMPQYRFGNSYRDSVYGINKSIQEKIQQTVLTAYEDAVCEENKEEMGT